MKYLSIILFLSSVFIRTAIAQNPAIDAPFPKNADPSAHVWSDGKVYVYVTYDNKNWLCYSSFDLTNWEMHDLGFGLENTGWAKEKAWAPDAMERNGKYYFYYPASYGESKSGMHTGVAISDKPAGPFTEALGEPLLENAHDPAVFKDDDGECYLYSQNKVVKLNEDMISLAEPVSEIELVDYKWPEKKEAVFVFKRDSIYYWTMAENWNTLIYATGDNPYGPFTYQGRIMDPYGGNNHHSVIFYKGNWYLFYHRWMTLSNGSKGRRVCIEELKFNPDNTIQKVESTNEGVNLSYLFPKKKPLGEMWYEDKDYVGYLFIHMRTDDYGKMYYALSKDGLHFKSLNNGERINDEYYGHSSLTRGHDGKWYLVGGGTPITFWVSDDLISWEKHSDYYARVEKTPGFTPGRENQAGAPKLFYDTKTNLYMITWQTTQYKKRDDIYELPFVDERYWGGHRALFALSNDLKSFSDPRLLLPNFDSGVIDVFVTRIGEKYYTIFKDERYPSYEWPTGKSVRIASSDYLTKGYSYPGPKVSPNFREAPSIVPKLDGTGYYLYFEQYPGNRYEIATAPSIDGPWYDVYKEEYSFEEDARHGWVHPITQKEWDAIMDAYGQNVEF